MKNMQRREFLKLMGLAGVVFSSGLPGLRDAQAAASREFYFVQMTDTHYGFGKKKFNPDPEAGLVRAINEVNGLSYRPDFIVFTGDLTHTTDDPKLRRQRMAEFRNIVSHLDVETIHFMPGEHDASLDAGKAYREFFGELYYAFEHKGIQFIALDNVSDPRGILGSGQLQWLRRILGGVDTDKPVVVLAHRPLFDLYPEWGWSTGDGAKAIAMLKRFRHVTVFYGHIHQEHHYHTGHIAHHSSRSLIFPLPAPGSVAVKKPLAWDPARPFHGLGLRSVELGGRHTTEIDEISLYKG
ncbi:MAG TPA: metallophosphoesterase [Gammaproteobacteria bacterium]|nr:metallophosphoesterase [Gammaproteobacteria bacterium]